MKIQIKSDMHHEFFRRYGQGVHDAYVSDMAMYNPRFINPEADVLVLAGDIIVATDEQIQELKDWLTSIDKEVIYIPGNHEYYGSTIPDVNKKLYEAFFATNVHFLYDTWKIMDNVIFIGGILWTKLTNPFAEMVHREWSDFKHIKDLNSDLWNLMHDNSVDSIKKLLKFTNFRNLQKVVVTHFVPHSKSTPRRYLNDPWNVFFQSNLEKLILDEQPDLWIHGHTHDSFDYQINGTRIVCNPYGYFPKAINPEYKRDLIVEI